MRLGRVLSKMNVQLWSDHLLTLVNSVASVVGLIAAAVVLICVALIYFTNTEATERAKDKRPILAEKPVKSSRLPQIEAQLAEARRAAQVISARFSQVPAEPPLHAHPQHL